ncbi:MAG TPA: hypothetical protein VGP70_18265 [Actinomadura sp.]|nr:hypothetical protein [Actinomadura sp.]
MDTGRLEAEWSRHRPGVFVRAELNGEAGLLIFREGRLSAADTFDVRDGRITAIHRVLNPAKLSHPALSCRFPDALDALDALDAVDTVDVGHGTRGSWESHRRTGS